MFRGTYADGQEEPRVKMFTDAPEKSTYRSPPLLASRIDGSGYQQFWPHSAWLH